MGDRSRSELMEVTITLLSLGGFAALKYKSTKSTMMPKQKRKHTPKSSATTTTSVVASFCQAFASESDDGRTPLTHVPSVPIENLDASCMSYKAKPTIKPIVYWPGINRDDYCDTYQVLSTLRFLRRFEREDASSSQAQGRFLPQVCPIRISISRHGHLIGLGEANVIIVGEEKGVSSMIVPVSSTIKKVASRHKSSIPMVKIKGDAFKFGLEKDAMLRVLVSVSEVPATEKAEAVIPKSVVFDRGNYSSPDEHRSDRQKVARDSVIPESGSNDKEQVDSREGIQVAESKKEIKPTDSHPVVGGSLIDDEEPVRQEKPDVVGSWNVETAEETDTIPDMIGLVETAASLHIDIAAQAETEANISRGAGNTMSLCVLGAILGSPAPSCVKKHGGKRASAPFWHLDDGIEDEVPDLPFDEDTDPPDKEGYDLSDDFATASLLDQDDRSDGASENDEDLIDIENLDVVPDIDNLDRSSKYDSPAFYEPSIKKAVDSALPWSALVLILNCRAPTVVKSKQLEEELDNELFTFQEVEEEESSCSYESIDDIPSLADTDESPSCSPQRGQRDYKFNDSLDDNELLS